MGLSIRSPEVERMARELARREGRGMTEAISAALEAKLAEVGRAEKALRDRLAAISRECRKAPDLDPRSDDEILGYGEDGGFKRGRR